MAALQAINDLLAVIESVLQEELFCVCGSNVELDASKRSATNRGAYSCSTVYGALDIDESDSKVHVWTIQIVEMKAHIYIGIDSSHRQFVDGNFCFDDNESAFFGSNGFHSYDLPNGEQMYQFEGVGWKTGDTVQMEWDTQAGTLQYRVNDKNYGIAFYDIAFTQNQTDMTYNLAICLTQKHDAVQLIKHEAVAK